MSYRKLNTEKTIATLDRLGFRIEDRFPDSGILNICLELLAVAKESKAKILWISRPNLGLRLLVGLFVLFAVSGAIYSVSILPISFKTFGFSGFVALFESLINDLVLVGAAIFFLFTIETRVKRKRALKALFELRAIAHVVDSHQLTKDPSKINSLETKHSPDRKMNQDEMSRYLNYCSELLSLCGKIAALYAKGTNDSVVLLTINEIEDLTNSLSSKIWQKILVLQYQP